jgi:hypothetical protein
MKTLAAVAALCLFSSTAFAGQMLGVKVEIIRVDNTGLGLVQLNGTLTNGAACGAPLSKSFAFDTRTEGGRAFLATLTAAMLANRSVNISGTNACALYGGNVEDIETLNLLGT